MVNFYPLAAEIGPVFWGTPANFNGFCVLAAVLHAFQYWASAKLCSVEQRAPSIFGRTAITFDIGPHSSFSIFYYFFTYFEIFNHDCDDIVNIPIVN